MTENTEKKRNNRNRKRRPYNKNRSNNNNQSSQSNQNNQRSSYGNQRNNQKNKRRSRWNANRISEHFMKRDFDSRKKDCECSSSLRISLGLVGVIEAMRASLNKRIDIVTGYYCPDCRSRQYGVKRDFHHNGIAADIRVEGLDVVDLFLHAETYPEIKGLGINFDDKHVHIDTRKEDNRETWVEKDGEWILMTEENRSDYIPSTTTIDNEPKPADSAI
jgi:uncharacterized protein YcbK (DUF882 family)